MTTLIFIYVPFMALYLSLGLWRAYKIKSLDQFFIPKNLFTLPLATAGLVATQLGAGIILETADHTYLYGWYGLIYPLGLSAGLLLLHHKFAEAWHALHLLSTAQIFEKIYKSPLLRTLAACIFVVSLFGILCGEAIALKKMFLSASSVGLYVFVLSWVTLVLYTALGGLQAVLATDIAQTLLVYGVFSMLAIAFIIFDMPILPRLTSLLNNISTLPKHVFDTHSVISLFLLPALFAIISQQLAIYFFHARTSKIARQSAIYSTLILTILTFIPILFGIYARSFEVQHGMNPLIALLEKLFPEAIVALTLCAITAAVLSVADSLLCAIAAHISYDILKFTHSKKTLILIKVITCLVGLSALIGTFYIEKNLLTILFLAYNLTVSTLFVPIMLAFFLPKKYISKKAAWASVTTGLVSELFWKYQLLHAHYLLFNLLFATLAYGIIYLAEKKLGHSL